MWLGQHFGQEPESLVDPDGFDTGIDDYTKLNWLAYLVLSEGRRISQALFGHENGWRFMHSNIWPPAGGEPTTPLVYIMPSRTEDPVGWTGTGGDITKTYDADGELRTVTFDQPRCRDVFLRFRIAVRNEYPLMDLETALDRAFADVGYYITLAGVKILVVRDTEVWRWNPATDDTVLTEVVYAYRSVPLNWTSRVEWGTILREAGLKVEVKRALDDSEGEIEEVS